MKNSITQSTIRMWSRLGQRGTFFSIAMPEIGEEKENLRVLTADVALLTSLSRFQSICPEKFLNVGIAEQNMIGIAAGLAMEGRCVFATTYASFIAVRSLEHVRQHLAHLQCNIKVVGTAAGVVAARSGVAHWATEDIAFMRALPNIMVLSAADCMDAYKIAYYAANSDRPMYIRLSGALNCPIVNNEDYPFIVGKAVKLREGRHVAIIATGMMVYEAIQAFEMLQKKGITCTVYNMHTIKPIDQECLQEAFANHSLIVTMEEHNIIGGLGSAVAEYSAECGNAPKLVRFGIQDSYCDAGSSRWIWEQQGITDHQIAQRIKKELKEHDR